jgi:hypothetical protein
VSREADGGNSQGKRRERIGPPDQQGKERDGGRKIQRHSDHEKHCGHVVYLLKFSGQFAQASA